MVYIGFFGNGRFVDYDKFAKREKKFRGWVDRINISVLNKMTEYFE